MRITFLGGADEVGASSILVEISGRRVLVDAGIRPSPKVRWGLHGDQLPHLDALEQAVGTSPLGARSQAAPLLDAILVTHAHTDHTGALELVVGRFPDCPVYATPPTLALTRVLHQDARRIMQTRLDEEGDLPLFDDIAVDKLMAAFVPVPFNTRLPLADDLVVTFYPAGHIAGAAMIGIDSGEGRVLITGDVSVSPQRTVPGLKPPSFRPDVLILESTYGGRLHANRAVEERRLVERVGAVVGAGGKVLIPAFALGRAQEVLQILSAFRQAGEFAGVPVWVDGMVRAVCQAYIQFPQVLPLALQERGARFFDEWTRPVERAEQREALIWENNPAIIVSSSGMLAGGPSLSYARALAGQPQHGILLTGYQDEESPGRRLQQMAAEGRGSLKLGKGVVDVQCQLGTYGLSAHADEAQLISLTEILDPASVLLVHGDETARASLTRALRERGRRAILPHGGKSFEFSFRPSPTRRAGGIGRNRPLDLRELWAEVAGPGGNYFTLNELARVWWGNETGSRVQHAQGAGRDRVSAEQRAKELRQALEQDTIFFVLDERRGGLVRAQTPEQVEQSEKRAGQLAALQSATEEHRLVNQLVILQDAAGEFRLARVIAASRDRFWIEGEDSAIFPEQVVELVGPLGTVPDLHTLDIQAETLSPYAVLEPGETRTLDELLAVLPPSFEREPGTQAALTLALLRAGARRTSEGYSRVPSPSDAPVEPNQALTVARALFPSEARLRRCGYRLDQNILVLTFDFPDTVRDRFAEILSRLGTETRWKVEIDPEANQGALAMLAREVLPPGWEIVKGPSIYREEKRVSLTARAGQSELAEAEDRFHQATGYVLSIAVTRDAKLQPDKLAPELKSGSRTGQDEGGDQVRTASVPMEINAAYDLIRQALAGSTLYRTSLRGAEIMLSFISPQVGARYRQEIEALSHATGWPITVNPNPNQNAIVQLAQQLAARVGWQVVRGPSIHIDRAQVALGLSAPPDSDSSAQIKQEFEAGTGYELIVDRSAAGLPETHQERVAEPMVEIVLSRIRLTRQQQSLSLDPDKQRKAIEQLQRRGHPAKPIRVRRTGEDYLLLDGLYRLKAAQALGMERISAIVEQEL